MAKNNLMQPEYKITKLDPGLAKSTSENWTSQIMDSGLDEDVLLESLYQGRINYYLREDLGDYIHVYGLVWKNESYARSIIEVTHKRIGRSQLKLLQITLEPRHDYENRYQQVGESMMDHVSLMTHSIVAALSLTFSEHPADLFKVYARTDYMKEFLEKVGEALQKQELAKTLGLDISWGGRWLQIRKINT